MLHVNKMWVGKTLELVGVEKSELKTPMENWCVPPKSQFQGHGIVLPINRLPFKNAPAIKRIGQ